MFLIGKLFLYNKKVLVNIKNELLIDSLKRFISEINNGFLSYLFIIFVSFLPANLNWVFVEFGLSNEGHTISWYFLSASLLTVMHFGIFLFGNNIVKHNWFNSFKYSKRNQRLLKESNKFYLELL